MIRFTSRETHRGACEEVTPNPLRSGFVVAGVGEGGVVRGTARSGVWLDGEIRPSTPIQVVRRTNDLRAIVFSLPVGSRVTEADLRCILKAIEVDSVGVKELTPSGGPINQPRSTNPLLWHVGYPER
jgi:hypothetical protein